MKIQLYLVVLAIFVTAFLLTNSIGGQKVFDPKCKNRPVKQNFDIKRVCLVRKKQHRTSHIFVPFSTWGNGFQFIAISHYSKEVVSALYPIIH